MRHHFVRHVKLIRLPRVLVEHMLHLFWVKRICTSFFHFKAECAIRVLWRDSLRPVLLWILIHIERHVIVAIGTDRTLLFTAILGSRHDLARRFELIIIQLG